MKRHIGPYPPPRRTSALPYRMKIQTFSLPTVLQNENSNSTVLYYVQNPKKNHTQPNGGKENETKFRTFIPPHHEVAINTHQYV